MTVQELIDSLQEIEHKDRDIVIGNMANGFIEADFVVASEPLDMDNDYAIEIIMNNYVEKE